LLGLRFGLSFVLRSLDGVARCATELAQRKGVRLLRSRGQPGLLPTKEESSELSERKENSVSRLRDLAGVIVDDFPAFGKFLKNQGKDSAYVAGGPFEMPLAEDHGCRIA
jgi:hypothetical protein